MLRISADFAQNGFGYASATEGGHRGESVLSRVAALLATWDQRARQRRHLRKLPVERLVDIGVSAKAAAAEAAKPFWER